MIYSLSENILQILKPLNFQRMFFSRSRPYKFNERPNFRIFCKSILSNTYLFLPSLLEENVSWSGIFFIVILRVKVHFSTSSILGWNIQTANPLIFNICAYAQKLIMIRVDMVSKSCPLTFFLLLNMWASRQSHHVCSVLSCWFVLPFKWWVHSKIRQSQRRVST